MNMSSCGRTCHDSPGDEVGTGWSPESRENRVQKPSERPTASEPSRSAEESPVVVYLFCVRRVFNRNSCV